MNTYAYRALGLDYSSIILLLLYIDDERNGPRRAIRSTLYGWMPPLRPLQRRSQTTQGSNAKSQDCRDRPTRIRVHAVDTAQDPFQVTSPKSPRPCIIVSVGQIKPCGPCSFPWRDPIYSYYE